MREHHLTLLRSTQLALDINDGKYPEVPNWFYKVTAPLSFEPHLISDDTSAFVYMGTSGLSLYARPNTPIVDMMFAPNGSTDCDRTREGDAVQNIGIWATALVTFLRFVTESSDSLFSQAKSIEGSTNSPMYETRLRLIASVTSTQFMRLHSPNRYTLFSDLEYSIKLSTAARTLLTAKPDTTFSKVIDRTKRQQENITMINPRLRKLDRIDPQTGYPIYALW